MSCCISHSLSFPHPEASCVALQSYPVLCVESDGRRRGFVEPRSRRRRHRLKTVIERLLAAPARRRHTSPSASLIASQNHSSQSAAEIDRGAHRRPPGPRRAGDRDPATRPRKIPREVRRSECSCKITQTSPTHAEDLATRILHSRGQLIKYRPPGDAAADSPTWASRDHSHHDDRHLGVRRRRRALQRAQDRKGAPATPVEIHQPYNRHACRPRGSTHRRAERR